ncbi:MAG: hypothetical protein GWO07_07850 [Candidatus Dadabacteria bacterium]|nr:hypothetical protein [Candidatus Dadabacteria bacterium]NIS08657.1 hypothetical protein [Candidatus Dadabacteria bacterium]NIV42491.1 hypothetical protein [Candidatus Dadabacteria bacterium]NIX15373.1 hypothetical protein [Candidatus Dadabacteria bacterium]NIY22032.1 hypothetical protein [Candidatus Dadabacteria bacterium]
MKFGIPTNKKEKEINDIQGERNMADDGSKVALQQDTALEEQLMMLLSNNQMFTVKLSESKVLQDPQEGLKLLCDLVNQVVAFAEKKLRVNSSHLQKLLVAESANYPSVKLMHVNKNRLSPDTVINLFKGWASHPSDRQPIFDEIRDSLINIIKSYFSLFESSFRSDLIKKQWQEIYMIHIDELKDVISKIKF